MSVEKALRKARSLTKVGDLAAARQVYEAILATYPANKRALDGVKNLGPAKASAETPTRQDVERLLSLYREGRLGEALARGKSLVARYPAVAVLHTILGGVHDRLDRPEEAIASYERSIALSPQQADAHSNMGAALNKAGQHGRALVHLEEAIRLQPEYAEAHNNLGLTLEALGRRQEAAECFRRAIGLRADYAAAHRHLGNVISYALGDPHIAAMETALSKAPARSADAAHLRFALAKAHDDLGETDTAFRHFEAGNRIRKAGDATIIDRHRTLFNQLKTNFSPPPQGISPAKPGKRMIFIVGMPRSGTSLVEQILASHASVYGAGELGLLDLICMKLLAGKTKVSRRQLAALRLDYLAGIDAKGIAEPVVTDKMPTNFRWIGHIATAFPDAAIIHTKRDPVATCWSIFKHYFPTQGLDFAWDLEDLAAYYRLYEDLMAFWHERFPGRIHDLDYEALTENQEDGTRALLSACGLDWDGNCLDFHKTERAVGTASAAQVRRKMYKGSSDEWRRYESHLGALIEALGSGFTRTGTVPRSP